MPNADGVPKAEGFAAAPKADGCDVDPKEEVWAARPKADGCPNVAG